MSPAEADDKIVKLLRLAAQRDNANEAEAARGMACKIAERHGRDLGELERVAADEPSRATPSAPSGPGMTSEEFEKMMRDFGSAFRSDSQHVYLDLMVSLFNPPSRPAPAPSPVTRMRKQVARDRARLSRDRLRVAQQRLRATLERLRQRSRKFGGT